MDTVILTAVVVLAFVWIPFLLSSWKLAQEEKVLPTSDEDEVREEEEMMKQEA